MNLDERRDFRRDRYGLVGSRGYTLPDVTGGLVLPFDDLRGGAVPNLELATDTLGDDNLVILAHGFAFPRRLTIETSPKTKGARIVLGPDVTLNGVLKVLDENQTVILTGGIPEVGHSGLFQAQLWGPEQFLFVGAGSTTNGTTYVLSGRGRSIIVGDDCMFAQSVYLSTYDQHAIIDMNTGQAMNKPGDVVIEPHVWLGRHSTVGKHVVIGLGSVVGANALALCGCPRFSLFAGVPAKVIRSNTTWDRKAAVRPATVQGITALAASVPAFHLPDRP